MSVVLYACVQVRFCVVSFQHCTLPGSTCSMTWRTSTTPTNRNSSSRESPSSFSGEFSSPPPSNCTRTRSTSAGRCFGRGNSAPPSCAPTRQLSFHSPLAVDDLFGHLVWQFCSISMKPFIGAVAHFEAELECPHWTRRHF